MKRIIITLTFLMCLMGTQAQTGSITNIRVSQGTDTDLRLVNIIFDLAGSDDLYDITLEVSFDDGANYLAINSANITGSLTVAPGSNIELLWDGRTNHSGESASLSRIKITATTYVPPVTVPDAPTIGTAIAGDAQATVTFTAPTNDGGSTITGYTATSSPDGIIGTVAQAGSGTITVTGLTNGSPYTFTVTATNAVGTGAASAASNSVTPPLSIGDSYQGGIVAYILQSGDPGYDANVQHGLIAAYSSQTPDGYTWGCYQTEISGADGTAIGTGNQNTIDIETGCTTQGIAAEICAELDVDGYDDWYLPSMDELYKLYLNRNAIGGFATTYSATSNYWTSTEYSITSARFQSFYNGLQGVTGGKFNSLRVRAVRAF